MAVKCEACGLDVAEGANFCGHCGAPQTTQGKVAGRPTSPPTAGGTASDAGAQYLAPPPDAGEEKIIFGEHPSIRTALPSVGMVAAGALALILICQFFQRTPWMWGLTVIEAVIVLLAVLAIAYILLKDVIRRYSVHYKVTSQRIFITTGIFNKRTDEIELEKYKDVFVRQTVYDKLVGCGDVEVVTGDITTPTTQILDVVDPVAKKELIRAAARARKSSLGITRREEL